MRKLFLFITIVSLASACSSIRVSSDFDRDATFNYKTYAFTKEATELPIDGINQKRILDAVAKELTAKGFTTSETPDVWIDLKLKAEQKQQATSSSTPYYGAGYGYRWGGGFSTTTIDIENYVEGTLFVDMIDVAKKQLVWQGRATKTIDPDSDSNKREYNINQAVKTIFT